MKDQVCLCKVEYEDVLLKAGVKLSVGLELCQQHGQAVTPQKFLLFRAFVLSSLQQVFALGSLFLLVLFPDDLARM